jgi:hypothetical protein
VNTRDELPGHMLNAAACIKEHYYWLRWTTCCLHKWATEYFEVEGEILKNLFWCLSNLFFSIYRTLFKMLMLGSNLNVFITIHSAAANSRSFLTI